MKISIKSIAGSALFEGDFSCIADAVKAAVKSSADLRSADLRYADLRYADLRYADLRYADLRYADLRYADLRYANLRSADLSSANLRYANLRYANLSSANLSSIKSDFWNVLTYARNEVAGLRMALVEGRVNGSSYTGECACLVGTIANTRHCSYDGLGALRPDSGRPAERFFLGIAKGDTPDKSQFAALAVEWIDEWAALLGFDVTTPAAGTAVTAAKGAS